MSTISREVKSEPKFITACLITWLHAVSCLWGTHYWQSILRKRVEMLALSRRFKHCTQLKSTTKRNWTKEIVGRTLSQRNASRVCLSISDTFAFVFVLDGLCDNELSQG